MSKDFEIYSKSCGVNEDLGLVFGWAIICKENGQDYFDTQDDHAPEESMLKAATDFMMHSRAAHDMHSPDKILPGSVVFAFPLTTEIAKAFNIQTQTTGLMIAMRPDSPEILEKFASGEYTGFSIGGAYVEVEYSDE